ncbi:M20/M25/M40 family metallo-hydrolase [Naasia sp. SYSU D00948]|uniref:M20/M25/M40 family metallo-hydrolase n=1 Tax=Naasia sp. SYSU D00948 TaxID=2817379 RepID=UPI001B305B2C|nr:M20/M25/M40 family metallo-hydrolase [Naasia sp. SYSU D00948]
MPAPAGPVVDTARLERFRAMLSVPTVSGPHPPDPAFEEFLALLPELYPAVHAELSREVVAGHTLLYRWQGRSAGRPTVLLAHYDVVPADAERWRHPPFAATVTPEGRIVGRGTLDDKGALAALLEAVEGLVEEGFRPRCDVYLCFGHDEEVAGRGAAAVARLLEGRGVRPALVLDEGGAVVEAGTVRGVDRPLAVVGVTEKGVATLRLTVEQKGGHASAPPRLPATARLVRAADRIRRTRFPARLSPAAVSFVRTLAPHARGLTGLAFRSVRISRPLLARLFAALGDETRAMVCTTATITELSGSARPNVLAERASATVNVRIAAGSSVAEALARVRAAVRDRDVRIEVLESAEPSPVSLSSGPDWEAIAEAAAAIAPDAVVTPYVMLAASDGRHFATISTAVYRFTPFRMDSAARASIHGVDESIGVDTWLDGISFYRRLLVDR